ncbi:YeeE/YedE family protein [Rhodovibrionaceae bacterium A322]
MDLSYLLEVLGDDGAIALAGLLVGLLFGAFAQQSSFCLRAATLEFWHARPGVKLTIWLLTFSAALLSVQLLMADGALDSDGIRQINQPGTLSGAVIGGVLFGGGMILARGCASRLLVLSATGNLRALLAGLVLTVAAQASLRGLLSPLREDLSSWWVVPAEVRDLGQLFPENLVLILSAGLLVLALALSFWRKLPLWTLVTALGVGGTVALGWWLTGLLAEQSFDPITVQSVSFTGPSADTLMALVNEPRYPLNFGGGLVPGVFLGSLAASLLTGQFKLQVFSPETGLLRYLVGAVLMGFGGMLAGGCAVGAGVTGGSVLSLTAWVALLAMWLGAGITDRLLLRHQSST